LNSEKIWKIWKKAKLNSEKFWKIQKKNCEKICPLTVGHNVNLNKLQAVLIVL
jgi:hypothetical protein